MGGRLFPLRSRHQNPFAVWPRDTRILDVGRFPPPAWVRKEEGDGSYVLIWGDWHCNQTTHKPGSWFDVFHHPCFFPECFSGMSRLYPFFIFFYFGFFILFVFSYFSIKNKLICADGFGFRHAAQPRAERSCVVERQSPHRGNRRCAECIPQKHHLFLMRIFCSISPLACIGVMGNICFQWFEMAILAS